MCWCDPSIRTPCCGSDACHEIWSEKGHDTCPFHKVSLGRPQMGTPPEDQLTAAAASEITKAGRKERIGKILSDALSEVKDRAKSGDYHAQVAVANSALRRELMKALAELGFRCKDSSSADYVLIEWGEEDKKEEEVSAITRGGVTVFVKDPFPTQKNFGRSDDPEDIDDVFPQY